ncbi:MAG: DUF429 domain-containing protein [Gemmatimonadales bacterium]|nr:DUF429 domain-containing protein [Gemmatimonadales bacterium]
MAVISVDLAFKRHGDIGVAVLEKHGNEVEVSCVSLGEAGLVDPPTPDTCAAFIAEFADRLGVRVVLLDGPQGWKSPDNGLEHARVCEHELHTPAKTGLPGQVKPANYRRFVEFSIAVFDRLDGVGWSRLQELALAGMSRGVTVESYPHASWKPLGIAPLPAKAKATEHDISSRAILLAERFGLRLSPPGTPTHDQLQAIVSGLGGLGIEHQDGTLAAVAGVSPTMIDGTWREGYIVTPRLAGWEGAGHQ